ncbi:MAG: beta-eliminating lyase-related protein [Ancalomicrobiaceae bacterium]|nr:beta-eliminating lyase-related protein [Ancalomicrobiaceae bacterium]
MQFGSDNWAGASDKVMAALVAANGGDVPAYGGDDITKRLERRMAEAFGREVGVLLVATGTAANSLSVTGLIPPYGAVICHRGAHLNTDECGAPEFFGSNKLIALGGVGGKISRGGLAELLDRPLRGVHHVVPSVVSLTQSTELGTVYSVAEVTELAALAHGKGLIVHMDGARLANALVHTGASLAAMTWQAGVDILSFGATKGGCLLAEAIVVFDTAHLERLAYLRKRSGQLVSKHRILSAQFDAWLDGGHWLELARQANAMARRLAEGMIASGKARPAFAPEANEVFAFIAEPQAERLLAAGARFYDWDADLLEPDEQPAAGETLYRFVTSFRTTPEEVDRFLALLAQA